MTVTDITVAVALGIVIGVSLLWLLHFGFKTDSTDNSRWNRSGLAIYTDAKTGLQYLSSSPFGGLTPRLDVHGVHMTEEDDHEKP